MIPISEGVRYRFGRLLRRLGLEHFSWGDRVTFNVANANHWSNVEIGSGAKDLDPGDGDGKSVWVHLNPVRSPHIHPFDSLRLALGSKILPENLALHAFSMYVLKAKRGGNPGNKIQTLSFQVRDLPSNQLVRNRGEHVVKGLEYCHREIPIPNKKTNNDIERSIKIGNLSTFNFTKDQLRPVMEMVRDHDLINPKFLKIAETAFSLRK